jgi:hypothetical protein
LLRPSGTYSPPAEASTQGLKCKKQKTKKLILFSGTQVEKVGNPGENVKTERAVV